VNRAAIFIDDEDRHHYRLLLREACLENDIVVHAFVLMDNYAPLLLTPPRAEALAVAMRAVGQNYVQFFNHRDGRTGTLWQGGSKSCLAESDRYALMVCRYVELNPVRTVMVALSEERRGSSVHSRPCPLITLHLTRRALGATWEEWAIEYGRWLRAGIEDEEISKIRSYIAKERAFGCTRFQAMVEKALGLPAGWRNRGRPSSRSV